MQQTCWAFLRSPVSGDRETLSQVVVLHICWFHALCDRLDTGEIVDQEINNVGSCRFYDIFKLNIHDNAIIIWGRPLHTLPLASWLSGQPTGVTSYIAHTEKRPKSMTRHPGPHYKLSGISGICDGHFFGENLGTRIVNLIQIFWIWWTNSQA